MAAAAAEETDDDDDDDEENLALLVDKKRVQALQERRCDSKGRGGVYDPVLGICCHFCRYTTLAISHHCEHVLVAFMTGFVLWSRYWAGLASLCKQLRKLVLL